MGDSRNENILEATIEGIEYNDPPQSRIEDLLLELKETIEEGGGGGGGDGHTIQNADDVSLAQRNILKFAGTLKATDDSTNKKTVISDAAEEVEWSVWNAMTEAERNAYSAGKKLNIVNVPSADGTISADLMTLLWTNPSPSSAFAAQTITMDLSDYDFVQIFYKYITSEESYCTTHLVRKNNKTARNLMVSGDNTTSRGTYSWYRDVTMTDDGVTFRDSRYTCTGMAVTVDNNTLIPMQIYGIKKTINLKINAIASDVSTSASKCMMSDGETSVEDAFSYSTEETVTGKTWINGKPIYRKVIDFGNLPNKTTKVVNHNITNLDLFIKIAGFAYAGSVYFPIPMAYSDFTDQVGIFVQNDAVNIQTGSDRSAYKGYVILEYTKTTD